MNIFDRPLAITDVETTGLDSSVHEIIDIGLLVVNQRTLELQHLFECKVKPIHIETASPRALEINGYNEHDWRDASDLKSVMKLYAYLTKDAIFVAHNVTFDWSFIEAAFRETEVENMMDYHRLDLFSLAWAWARKNKSSDSEFKGLRLSDLCDYFHVPQEPLPHTGINGAMCEWEVLKNILPS